MPPNPDASGRSGKLLKLLKDVLAGKRKINSASDAELFMEAARSHESPGVCVESLIANSGGLEAVRTCVRANLSTSFIQSHTLKFIFYLSDPAVKALAEGQLLQQLL